MEPAHMLERPASCGQPAPGVEVVVLDPVTHETKAVGEVGRLYVRGSMMSQYKGDEKKTSEAFFGDLATVGDMAYLDKEGFLFLCDREDDMIISGGANIYPAEIEEVLHGHAVVVDSAVFGMPDQEYGQRVHAAVQVQPGTRLSEKAVQGWVKERLAAMKVPRSVSFHQELPRNSSGKMLKRKIKEELLAQIKIKSRL